MHDRVPTVYCCIVKLNAESSYVGTTFTVINTVLISRQDKTKTDRGSEGADIRRVAVVRLQKSKQYQDRHFIRREYYTSYDFNSGLSLGSMGWHKLASEEHARSG